MQSKLMRFAFAPLMALSLLVAGCENLEGPTGPAASAPSQSLLGLVDDDPNGFTVIREKDASVGIVAGVIGSGGGKLVMGKHELWVPRNAVSGATTFTMTKLDGQLRFSLTATKLLPNDVGSSGFAVPVKLIVDFRDAYDSIPDPSKLRIFWAKRDGSVEEQTTDIDVVGKRAIGHLRHFSDYILAMP